MGIFCGRTMFFCTRQWNSRPPETFSTRSSFMGAVDPRGGEKQGRGEEWANREKGSWVRRERRGGECKEKAESSLHTRTRVA